MRKIKLLLVAFVALFGVGSAFAMDKPTPKASALATDGNTIQYLYNVGAKAFFVGANNYGTRASFDPNHGYKFKVKDNGNGTFTLNDMVETKNNSWQQVFWDGQGAYVDNTSNPNRLTWNITIAGDGTFKISHPDAGEGYLGVGATQKDDTRLYFLTGENDLVTWIAVSEEDYTAWEESFSELPGYVTTTNLAALDGKLFRIQNEAKETICFGYGENGWDMFLKPFDEAKTAKACLFKYSNAEGAGVENYYYLRAYNINGENHTQSWAPGGYFNTQPANGNVCFDLGLNNRNGQDLENGAVWDIKYVEGQGFTLLNVGTGKYLKDAAPAKYDEPGYWTFAYEDKFIIPVGKTALANYRAALAAAKAVDQTQTMPTDVKDALIDAIAKYAEEKVLVESATAESVKNATDALIAAAAPAATFAEYRQALADAQAVDLSAEMNAALKSQFESDLETYAEEKVITETATLESIQDATAHLVKMTATVKQSIATFAVAKEILEAANGYDEVGKLSYTSNATIASIAQAYGEKTLEEVTDEQKAAAAAAYIVACKAQAQPANDCDMTPYIENPSFENSFTSWTNSGMAIQNNSSFVAKTGKNYAEAWQPNGTKKVSQAVTLPNGLYRLSAPSKARGVTSARLFAGDKETPITIADKEETYSVEFVSLGTELTIGFEGIGTGAGNSWICVDNFQLTYVRPLTDEEMLPLIKAEYQTVLAAAQAVDQTADMAQAALDGLVQALDTYAEDKVLVNEATKESIKTAIDVLAAATESAKASIIAAPILPEMKAFTETTNVYTQEAYNEYYAQYYEKYVAGTLTTAEARGLQNPNAGTGWHAANTVDNFLLSAWDTNPDFINNPTYYINTWSVEGNNDGTNFKVPFFEYWTGDANSLGEKTLTATMTGLEKGLYEVSAWVRVRTKNNAGADAEANGITLQANEGEAVDVTKGENIVALNNNNNFYLDDFKAKGVVSEDGTLKIKFNVASVNNISWLSFKNVMFERIGDATAISEVAKKTAQKSIFNVAGQQMKNLQKGLNIVDGKKIYVK